MQKLSIIITLILLLSFLSYSLHIISEENKCTSVRAFQSICR
ncbi:hypothetical protein [Candidatus Vampirococcus lugosii]|uniref:Uncharacterized protein n=1 Tax=Candidatus Vampirococcus lugosii TaxID=2789015 RepID=A0ABS5QKY2_9BACT|nr:hypothetical protein [Candidatus Vampirococcus lugosii]MBS8121856.1 hypothetical protein [Candidatus Vampirococcus lugosii]